MAGLEEPFDLVLILSVIKTPKLPLSYTWKRSSFSHFGRWKQTQDHKVFRQEEQDRKGCPSKGMGYIF